MGQLAHAQDEPPIPPPLPGTAGPHIRQVLIADYTPGVPRIFIVTQGSPVGQIFSGCNGPSFCEEILKQVGADRHEHHNVINFTEEFFKNSGVCSGSGECVCDGQPACHVGFVGVPDAHEHKTKTIVIGPPCSEDHPVAVIAKFVRQGCPCTAAGECACANHASCGQDCAATTAPACKCCPCAAEAAVAAQGQAAEATCGEECHAIKDVLIRHVRRLEQPAEHDPLKLMQHIAGLVGEKAAAQAALAVRKEADDQIGELVETMAELLADNAALDAKLEAQNEAHAEQRKLLEKVADLATENARLKAHVELAAERAELARGTAALTLENERLKLRIVELEQKHALAEAARTAAKPKERKAR